MPITNCPSSLPGDGVALSTGTADFTGPDFPQNYVVTDTQPPPTTKAHCKHGSWRAYPQFRNQGDCVSCVATAGKNPPASSP